MVSKGLNHSLELANCISGRDTTKYRYGCCAESFADCQSLKKIQLTLDLTASPFRFTTDLSRVKRGPGQPICEALLLQHKHALLITRTFSSFILFVHSIQNRFDPNCSLETPNMHPKKKNQNQTTSFPKNLILPQLDVKRFLNELSNSVHVHSS